MAYVLSLFPPQGRGEDQTLSYTAGRAPLHVGQFSRV